MNLTWTIYERHLGRIIFVPEAVVFTDDPKTFKNMQTQLNRWTCAFFQNFRKHAWLLLRNNQLAFGFVIGGLTDLFFMPTLLLSALAAGYMTLMWMIAAFMLLDTMIIGIVACWGARRFKMVRQLPKFMLGFWALRILTAYYFFKWGLLTGLLGKSVGKYEKGH